MYAKSNANFMRFQMSLTSLHIREAALDLRRRHLPPCDHYNRYRRSVPMQFASRVKKVQSSAIRDLLRYGADPSVISFGGGYPDPELFPSGELRAIYEILLTRHAPRALQYTVSDGIPELRAQIAERMRNDGTPCTASDIICFKA